MEVRIEACEGQDFVPAVKDALARLRKAKGRKRLVFSKARYEFWPKKAEEAYFFPSNNDHSLKRVAFTLSGFSDLEIDGQGAEFLFHGKIMPFALVGARRLWLHGFSFDFKRPFHNEARIADVCEGHIDLSIDKDEYPFEVFNGLLLFRYEDGELFESCNRYHLLEFDPGRRETAYKVYDLCEWGVKPRAEQLENGLVRLFGDFGKPRPQKGNIYVFGPFERNFPGIFCAGSKELTLSDLTIHHSGGMGVIAQRCEGIKLERVSISPSRNGKRIISTSADATHFVNCKGKMELLSCLFENQLDDPSNIHGIYARITGKPSPDTLEVNLVHRQQAGVEFIGAGDLAEIIDSKTLLTYASASVESADFINKDYLLLKFSGPLPETVKLGDSVGNATWSADLTIRDCVTRGNRARGFLVSTPGKVLVERNIFHNPGAAVLIEGDANFWFESGAVRDVTIRENRFENCNYGVWGVATIQITPGVNKEIKHFVPYHRNIRVLNNHFTTFSKKLLYARGVEGVSFEGNTIELSGAYPSQDEEEASAATFACCDKISVKDNKGADSWTICVDGKMAGTLGTPFFKSGN